MSIVILDREGKTKRDFMSWAIDCKEKIYILGYKETVKSFDYEHAIGFPNFETNGNVEQFIYELHKKDPVKKVLSFEEGSVIRAAVIRENLGIEGQNINSALIFRDKFLMKMHAKEKGINIPKFKEINHFMDIVSFIDEIGYPVILKPRLKWASKGVIKISSDEELNEFLSNSTIDNYIIEDYIDGELYHTDGLYFNNQLESCCISRNLKNCFEAYRDGSGHSTIMINQTSVVAKELKHFTNKLLQEFDVDYNTIFHAEIFVDKDNNFYLCEIASRMIGIGYKLNIKSSFGLDFDEIFFKKELGILNSSINVKKHMLSGRVLIPPKVGFVKKIPKLDMNGIIDIDLKDYENVYFHGLQKQYDNIMIISFFGDDEYDLEKKAFDIKLFYDKYIEWGKN